MEMLLFIDDEEGVRRSVRRALKREPYPVFTAETGEAGLRFFSDHLDETTTVVTDYKMPGMDGLETLARITALKPEVTTILLTGYATLEAAIQATNQGVDGFLTKPFENSELRARIREFAVRRRLRQFVPEALYDEICQSLDVLAPRCHEVTVLFSDIRGFTPMSRNADPETLAAFLNREYFTPMGEIAYAHCGMIDKHIGDSLMVVFGCPLPSPDDPRRAVASAHAMQSAAAEIDRRLRARGALRLTTGIGMATGRVFCGVFGSFRKKEYTVVGMPVNLAARLEKLAAPGEILMCPVTFRRAAAFIEQAGWAVERRPGVAIKGLAEPLTLYRIAVPAAE